MNVLDPDVIVLGGGISNIDYVMRRSYRTDRPVRILRWDQNKSRSGCSRRLQRRQRSGVAVADQQTLGDVDPHEEIVRLEEHIEELSVKIESCRKFILASRIAIAGGGVVLAAMLLGAIRSDLGLIAASVASFLGGIVVWGSNSSTAKEAVNEMAAAESERAALIEHINPRVVS